LIEAATRQSRGVPGSKGPPPTDELIVVGREPVAIALVKIGRLLDFTVMVVDPLLGMSDVPAGVRVLNTLDFSLLPETARRYVVVASRGKFDEEAVEQALHAHSAYVGLVASNKRGQEIRRSLERKGESAEKLATVRAPAGLDIGAKTPEEIALSILVEIVSQRVGKQQQ
jgi:xanthine dehydrogenase accessory factor